jgi:hypothetical protein
MLRRHDVPHAREPRQRRHETVLRAPRSGKVAVKDRGPETAEQRYEMRNPGRRTRHIERYFMHGDARARHRRGESLQAGIAVNDELRTELFPVQPGGEKQQVFLRAAEPGGIGEIGDPIEAFLMHGHTASPGTMRGQPRILPTGNPVFQFLPQVDHSDGHPLQ